MDTPMDGSVIDDCTALLLAGGKSRRMGEDKATTLLGGTTLLDRTIQRVQPYFSKMIISVRQQREQCPWPQLCDQPNGQGPMAGVFTALKQITTPWLFVVACDMPFVSTKLIHAMASQRRHQEAIAAKVAGHLQPLLALYSTTSLPRMEQKIRDKNRSLQQMLKEADTTIFNEDECRRHDPDLLSFVDIDTPAAIIHAEKLMNNPSPQTTKLTFRT